MREIEGGYINHASLVQVGVVSKKFSTISTESEKNTRLKAERFALKNIPLAPAYFGQQNDELFMSFVEGEHRLDSQLRNSWNLSYKLRDQMFHSIGDTLQKIHSFRRFSMDGYHESHDKDISSEILHASDRLTRIFIDPNILLRGMRELYNESEVEKRGLVFTHGDYWLNNIYGKVRENAFVCSGVIDWEFSGVDSPYRDFGMIKMSMEDRFVDAGDAFWAGYGSKPEVGLQTHYAAQIMVKWMISEKEAIDFSSDFYLPKVEFLQGLVQ
ncbi:aminoglycoside phosphotransferase family protein [Candidatus Gottesmanbacteria bacterium]|nr:aminoglycoside phosphotransferase family protein [Candidatus Gottesmanbacteria bacterium]